VNARRRSFRLEFRRARVLYLLVLPAVAYFAIFSFLPLASGVVISFEHFRFVGATTFAGFANFRDVFITPGFWQAFVNTLLLSLGNVILTATVPMGVALSLNEVLFKPGKRFVQSVIYTPYLFSWVVVGGIWIFLLSPSGGMINSILSVFGIKPIYFLAQSNLARPIFIGVNLWKQMGYVCIIYLASVSAINPELYEAAMIDGAGGFKRAVYITVPELISTLKVVLLLNVMGALQIFDQVYVMRNDVIAPKVDVLMYYVYVEGLNQFRIGYASAVSVFIFLITLSLTLLTRRFTRYRI
jgi:putative aldouronate transport system permease protein